MVEILNKLKRKAEIDILFGKRKLCNFSQAPNLYNYTKNNVINKIWLSNYFILYWKQFHIKNVIGKQFKGTNRNMAIRNNMRENKLLQNFIKNKYKILYENKILALISFFAVYGVMNHEEKKKSSSIHNNSNNNLKKRFFGLFNTEAECCGIMAYLGNSDASKILVEGIEILQNRGYDSCGISTICKNNILKTTKFASTNTSDAIEKLKSHIDHHKNDNIGIAHTRWATNGSKTSENAHPHNDYKNRISIVHNGIIENYSKLKEFLLKKNIQFKSTTDTEVVANLIGHFLDQNNTFENAALSAIKQLEGKWSFCIIHKDHADEMVIATNGSPLHIGFENEEIFIASEYSALSVFTNKYNSLSNGEIFLVKKKEINALKLIRQVKEIPEIIIEKTPSPYPHWTIKEIHEQPSSILRSLNNGGRLSIENNSVKLGGLDSQHEKLSKIENLFLIGCGSSYYAALFGKCIMIHLKCLSTIQVIDPYELNLSIIPKEAPGLIFISQSGETGDIINAFKLADDHNITSISIVNTVSSTISNMVGCGVYLNAGKEIGVASTKSFTSEVSVLCLIALWFCQNKKNYIPDSRFTSLIQSLHNLSMHAEKIINSCEDICISLSDKLCKCRSIYIAGNGISYPIALEGALKIKELCYIHCEGFTGNALKHGPFALLGRDEDIPVIMLVFNDNMKNIMVNTGEQIKSRGSYIICITDDEDIVKDFADYVIKIPNNGILTAALSIIPLQMIAYYISVKKGINPDKPRCLAKTVTVS